MKKPSKQFALRAEVRALGARKGEVRITSEIARWKWDEDTVTGNDFHRKLEALGDVDEITVKINSPGGNVTEAVNIRTELMRSPAAKVIDIEGLCASAATIIACVPGARVRMAQGSEYMIHRCYFGAYGHADDVLAAYNSMMVTDGNMADIYAERTGKSQAECLEMMTKETWMTAKDAIEAGFVDEMLEADDGEMPLVACAVSGETLALMRECYAHTPEYNILPEKETGENEPPVSNGNTAVAADGPSENKPEGVTHMELRDATAEQLQQENPALAQSIAQQAVAAERERMGRIDKVTPKGARFAEMAKKAKADGTSVEDYLAQVIEAQEQSQTEYLEARSREIAPANNVGGGDSQDHDEKDAEAQSDKLAKELADLANGMRPTSANMA